MIELGAVEGGVYSYAKMLCIYEHICVIESSINGGGCHVLLLVSAQQWC